MSSSSEGAHLQDGGEVAQQWTKTGPIAVSMAPDDVRHLQGTQEVTAAEPAPLGLLGLATGTIAIGYVLSGSTAMAAQIGTAPVLLVFAGIALFVAGLWRSRKDNTFAATAFCCYGANNTVVGSRGAQTQPGVRGDLSAARLYAAGTEVVNSVFGRVVAPLAGKA